MTDLADLLIDYRGQIDAAPRVLVGYSGGLDSSVMLAATAELIAPERILAVHINHQIHPHASHWEEHCHQVATSLNIAFYSEKVRIDSDSGIEEQARTARYQVFERLLGDEDILLLGHHADDQVETFLFRLFRGSGVKGLSAIPPQRPLGRGRLLRPLLKYAKQDLQAAATKRGIEWIEDPSNEDSLFDRNFIRNELLLLIKDRWTAADKQVLSAVDMFRETDMLLSEVAEQDLQLCGKRAENPGVSVEIPAFNELSGLRQDNLLRRFIFQQQGIQPNQDCLRVIRSEILQATEDAQPQLKQASLDVRRFKDRLYLTPFFPDKDCRESVVGAWPSSNKNVELPGVWKAEKLAGPDVNLRVDFRRGGERAKPQGRGHSQSLKKLLLENEVEPWLRDWLPIIYCGDEIVAVGDRIQCSNFRFQMQWSIEQGV